MRLEDVAVEGFRDASLEALRTVARECLKNRSDVRCMQHPLGFYYVLLYEKDRLSIRLHYWPAGDRPCSSAVTPYHDHVWRLQSCVLAGRIENVILSLKKDARGPFDLATIRQVAGVDEVVPGGERVSIDTEDVSEYSAGDSYSILPEIFHFTRVASEVAAVTLVRAEVVSSGGPRTLVPAGYLGQAPARAFLSEVEASSILDRIQELIS